MEIQLQWKSVITNRYISVLADDSELNLPNNKDELDASKFIAITQGFSKYNTSYRYINFYLHFLILRLDDNFDNFSALVGTVLRSQLIAPIGWFSSKWFNISIYLT